MLISDTTYGDHKAGQFAPRRALLRARAAGARLSRSSYTPVGTLLKIPDRMLSRELNGLYEFRWCSQNITLYVWYAYIEWRGMAKIQKLMLYSDHLIRSSAVIKKFDRLKMLSIILPTRRKKSVLPGDCERNLAYATVAEITVTERPRKLLRITARARSYKIPDAVISD
ncbi:hypothetical protein EVAR_27486_1 [Eumeta japonica]|uniref:Uncharacterized protein n=1 Tax=Eumeta variegata TaxID=151549 RepID=A0A4C1XH34_EUMVA|nr:hypothetical protein EVAR_27486_1 [Eumeta japonica]